MTDLERVTISLERDLLARFDERCRRFGQANRSEAIRDLIRDRLVNDDWTADAGETAATLTLVYDHHQRELSERLLELGHEERAKVIASLHVHLDRHMCLEVLALRGKPSHLRALSEQLCGLKGVRHGKLAMTSLDP